MKWLDPILDVIFPKRCRICGALSDEPFCLRCFSSIVYLQPSAFFHAVGVYEGALRKAIHHFKFNRRKELSSPLGYLLIKYLNRHLNKTAVDMVIPVPLHEKRLKERGFNQSELLCQEITRYYNYPTISGLLLRCRETHPQFELKRHERLKNVRGAFEVKGGRLLQGKSVLLVDDIYTTGFTISECTRALKQSGAQQVHILALSRAVEDHQIK